MEAMWTWFIPAIVDIKRRVEERARSVGSRSSSRILGITVVDEGGRHRRIDLAGGALLDLGIYPISLARFTHRRSAGQADRRAGRWPLGPAASTAPSAEYDPDRRRRGCR